MTLDPFVLALLVPVAGALALAWRWRPRGAIEPGVLLLLAVFAAFGAWALAFSLFAPAGLHEPEALAIWKPTILYWTVAFVLLVSPRLGWGVPAKAIVGTYFTFSSLEWRWINRGVAFFCAILGALNIYIATTDELGGWEGFKFASMVNVVGLLLLRLTFLWIDTLVRAVSNWMAQRRLRP